MNVRALVDGHDIHYEYWYGSYQGLIVQVVAFGEPNQAQAVRAAHQEFLTGIKLLDPNKIFTVTGDVIAEPIEHPEEGFRLVFDKPEWIFSETVAREYPAAVFTASSIHGGHLQVVRLELPGPAPGMDAIIEALLESQNMNLEDQTILENRNLTSDDGTIVRKLVMEVPGNPETIRDHYRIWQDDEGILMINTWIEEGLIDEHWRPETLIDSLERLPVPKESMRGHEELPVTRQVTHARIVNRIGLHYFMRERYERAMPFFVAARDMDPNNPIAAGNIVHALFRQGKYEETIEQADTYLPKFPEHTDLMADKAQSWFLLDRPEEAAAAYAQLAKVGFEHDDLLLEYLNILIELDRIEKANKVIDREMQKRPSTLLRRRKIQMLKLSGQYEAAEEALLALGEATGWNSNLFADAIALYEDQGEHEQALTWIDRKEAQIGVSFDSVMARGRNSIPLGSYQDAREAFEAALDRRPHDPGARKALDQVIALIKETSDF